MHSLKNNSTSITLFAVSYPKGDIELLVGSDPIEIFCHLNPHNAVFTKKGVRSSQLSFHVKPRQNTNLEWTRLESHIINETTITAKYNPDKVAKGEKDFIHHEFVVQSIRK